jgi:hypothetical protein
LHELRRRGRGKGECARVPAFQLGEAATCADLGLEQANVGLGRDDPRFDVFD